MTASWSVRTEHGANLSADELVGVLSGRGTPSKELLPDAPGVLAGCTDFMAG